MFLTDSTSDNSGHTATPRSAKIRQSQTLHVRKPLSEISQSAVNLKRWAKYEIMWWAVEAEKNKTSISLYILNETNLKRCEYGKFCWDKIDKQISEGWHSIVVEVDFKGSVTLFVDEKLAGKLKLKLKGLNGYMSIFSDRSELGVNHVKISKERYCYSN